MWARRHVYVGLRHTTHVPESLRDALQGTKPLKPGPLTARVPPGNPACLHPVHLQPGAHNPQPGTAFPLGARPPCPVSQFALYQVDGGTTVILSNRDAGAAVEMYATPREGEEDLLRAVAADLIAGFYGSAASPQELVLAGNGVPPGTAVAVQVFSAGRHLITAMKGHADASDAAAEEAVDVGAAAGEAVDVVATVDAMVQLTVCSGGGDGQLTYRHVNTRRARKRVLL